METKKIKKWSINSTDKVLAEAPEDCYTFTDLEGNHVAYVKIQPDIKEGETNLFLIEEANHVLIETGLTPRQLSQQRNSMVEAMKKLQEWHKKYPPGKIYPMGQAATMERELTEVVELQLSLIQTIK